MAAPSAPEYICASSIKRDQEKARRDQAEAAPGIEAEVEIRRELMLFRSTLEAYQRIKWPTIST
jgi:hypothetical protein